MKDDHSSGLERKTFAMPDVVLLSVTVTLPAFREVEGLPVYNKTDDAKEAIE